jgi:hypothetical protein
LFGVVESSNLNSKIFKYQKSQKILEEEFNLYNLILGPDVDYLEDGR